MRSSVWNYGDSGWTIPEDVTVPVCSEHVLEKHENCEVQNCVICDGGLGFCTICHVGDLLIVNPP